MRHKEILQWLHERGTMRVSDMALELNVSAITIRRDVDALSKRGLLTRVHGGAVLPEPRGQRMTVVSDGPAVVSGTGGRELVLGLIVPAADYYFPEVIKGAREAAAERGIRLVLGISQYDPEEERAQARRMLEDGIHGLLITPCGPVGAQSWPAELDVPCVLIERHPDDDAWGAERVVTDHAYGARIAVRHLVDCDRELISLILREDSPHSDLILEGYRGGLAAVGMTARESSVFRLPSPSTDPAERERKLTDFADKAANDLLEAVIVHDDHDAIVVLQRLRARGVDIPNAVAIVAYDDEVAALADIPLTAVAPPKRAVGAAAVDLIVRRLIDPERPTHRLAILPELNVRASSALE
ncbi:substrate-binding domain-containing protein [Streptomyces sp. NPDC056716]|uniref:substrate-binding domain-containing protein n=1 Tax=unclassified Streptomyces TaxID=2593676 RepID=UPI0036AB1BBD